MPGPQSHRGRPRLPLDSDPRRDYNPRMGLMRSGPNHQGKRPSPLVVVLWVVVVVVLAGWIAALVLHG